MAIHGGASSSSWLAAVCLLLLGLLALQGAAEPLVPAMFVFGDSMVDVGNNNFIKDCDPGCKANYPRFGVDYLDHAPTGRFSNGYNLADQLAKLLGFDESPPPFLSLSNASRISRMSTGINFASGGSGLLNKTGNGKVCYQVFSMTEQVGNFTSLARQWASGNNRSADLLSKSLFFINAGSNDLFEYADRVVPQISVTELLQSLVASYAAYLKDLYDAGARKFSLMGTSLLGCCPSQRAYAHDPNDPKATDKYGCFAEPNNLSVQLYPMFDAMLKNLSRELHGMNYSLVDSFNMTQWVLNSPPTPAFNFTVLDTACCGDDGPFGAGGCNISANLCTNRSNYLFWDDYHPTEAATNIAATAIFEDPGIFVHPINVKQLVGGGAA